MAMSEELTKLAKHQDQLIYAFLIRHNCDPKDCELVHTQTSTGHTFSVRHKVKEEYVTKLEKLLCSFIDNTQHDCQSISEMVKLSRTRIDALKLLKERGLLNDVCTPK